MQMTQAFTALSPLTRIIWLTRMLRRSSNKYLCRYERGGSQLRLTELLCSRAGMTRTTSRLSLLENYSITVDRQRGRFFVKFRKGNVTQLSAASKSRNPSTAPKTEIL